MFRVYKIKPKVAEKIKAVQVTKDTIVDLSNILLGRMVTAEDSGKAVVTGLEFPTLSGPIYAPMTDWIIREEGNVFRVMSDAEFTENWEVARNTEKPS